MTRPLVKICGVSEEREIDDLAALGVDFYGLVIGVPSPWTITTQRARELSDYGRGRIRPTLVTGPYRSADIIELIQQTGATAFQSAPLVSPEHLREIRDAFTHNSLTILQGISYRHGEFWKEEQIDAYLDAGADYILIDHIKTPQPNEQPETATIPLEELAAFFGRHRGKPMVIAGGICSTNVRSLLRAGDAAGIDVCSAVRRDGRIRKELVADILRNIPDRASPSISSPSLRQFLDSVESGNHVIAYLTLGDPPNGFVDVAEEVLAAGALTLELGFPSAKPNEGATLQASHQRALDAGVTTSDAMRLFQVIAERHRNRPLIAVVQWPAIDKETELIAFLDALVEAGAAAVLPVGLPIWQLPAFAARVHERGLETVIPCAPNATHKRRALVYPYCSGGLYVPRGEITGGSRQFDDFAEFCRVVSMESSLPIIVGVGVRSIGDVMEICRTPAKAAAVGSALVEHLAKGGCAGEFVSRLIGNG